MSEPDEALPPGDADRRPGPPLLGVIAAAVGAIVVAFAVVVLWDGADEAGAPTTSTPPRTTAVASSPPATAPTATTPAPAVTSTAAVATTATATRVTPTSAAPAGADGADGADVADVADLADLADAVWPWADSAVRYADPVAAARGFAVDFVGITDPLVGEFRPGDARSGEVEVRAVETFAPTTVFVRRLGADDSWWAVGSATSNIVLDTPTAGDTVSSPLALAGRATAFEGTVDVRIRADGDREPLFVGFVTGGGAPDQLEPFDATLEWPNPGVGSGALVLSTSSSDDGRILEAAVVRLRFGPG